MALAAFAAPALARGVHTSGGYSMGGLARVDHSDPANGWGAFPVQDQRMLKHPGRNLVASADGTEGALIVRTLAGGLSCGGDLRAASHPLCWITGQHQIGPFVQW
ncbi:MAG: hypothetical protein JO227_20815 [Acetobacteraceae bacterium]|nr:hypothetical protein [Acetobacteraceae bacterium]